MVIPKPKQQKYPQKKPLSSHKNLKYLRVESLSSGATHRAQAAPLKQVSQGKIKLQVETFLMFHLNQLNQS